MRSKRLKTILRPASYFLCLVSCILCLALPGHAQEPEDVLSTLSLFEKTEKIKGEDFSDPYQLAYWPIIPDTDRVWIDGALKSRDVDYTIDYRLGRLSLKADFAPDSIIRVDYQVIPISVRKFYQRQLFAPAETLPSERVEPLPGEAPEADLKPATAEELPSTLNFSGTKTLSLSMESIRGLTINQPTRLNVNGKVSESVSVMAMLSDQDLPLQPEGTTEELEDLDRILIKIEGQHLSATLGDYEAAFGETEFVLLPKMLEGAQAQGEFDVGGFTVLGAVSRGQTSSITLRGMEGQREYRINVDGRYIVMIAGSETVWLNGEEMRRGEENDYVIRDYGDPTVEFTNKHLITSSDVIVVDFEYIEEDRNYRQDLYGTRGKVNLFQKRSVSKGFVDGVTIGASYATESDDKDNPLIPLNEEEIASLKLNDLDPDEDGILLPAPVKHSVLGLDGRLNVSDNTSLIGEVALNKRDLNTFSTYDKPEEGVAWKLNGASGTDRFNVNLDFRKLDPGFVPIGATFSSRTRATYQEDYEDISFGEVASLALQPFPSGETSYDMDLWYEPVEHIRLSADLGQMSNEYSKSDLSSLNAASKRVVNHWSRSLKIDLPNLPEVRTRYQEAVTEIDGRDDLKKTRELWEMDHKIWEKLSVGARSEEIESLSQDGDTELQNSTEKSPQPPLQGGVSSSYGGDRRREERRLIFEVPAYEKLSLSGEYSQETEYANPLPLENPPSPLYKGEYDHIQDPATWSKLSSASTVSANLFARPRSWLDFSGYFARRKFSRLLDSGIADEALPADSTTNLADLKLNLKSLRINYQIDRKLSTEREEQYVNYILTKVDGEEERRFLQPGEGSYVKIDEYTFREDMEKGDYIRLVRTVRDRPVTSLALQSVFSLRPRRPFRTLPAGSGETERISPVRRMMGLFSLLELEAGVRISEEQESASRGFYLLQDLQTDETIYGLRRYWSRAQLSPVKRFSLTANWETGRTLNKRINNSSREFESDRWSVRFESPLTAKFSLGGEWEQDDSSETVSSLLESEPISDISERRRDRSVFLRYQLTRTLSRLKLEGSYETERDHDALSDEPPVLTKTVSLGSEATWSFRGRGTAITKYEIARGTSSGELPFARYDFHEGISHRIRLQTNYRLKWFTDMTARLIYRAEFAEREKPDHRLEMEMTANF
jgi:hypothetical protein